MMAMIKDSQSKQDGVFQAKNSRPRRSQMRWRIGFLLFFACGASALSNPAQATTQSQSLLNDIASGRFFPDSTSCQCEVDQRASACPSNLTDLLPTRFRLFRSVTYGPDAIGSPTPMGSILFHPSRPKYSSRYEINLSEVAGQIVSRKKPEPNPIYRAVQHKRQFDENLALNSYRETYRQNGVVLAVVSHGWKFKKLSRTQIEFKNYDQSEEYADIDSGVPHSIPIVRNQVITCVANRR